MCESKTYLRSSVPGVLLLLLVFFAGCGASNVKNLVTEDNQTNVERLRTCYLLYGARHKYAGPQTEEELKEFLRSDGSISENLKLLDLRPDSIDKIFVSERDDEPLVVRWGLTLMPDSKSPVVFEAKGVDGMRKVAFADGSSKDVDETEYQGYLDGEGN